jgi:hypothetical protein
MKNSRIQYRRRIGEFQRRLNDAVDNAHEAEYRQPYALTFEDTVKRQREALEILKREVCLVIGAMKADLEPPAKFPS